MYILGISCYYHDSAACLLKDGVVIAAAQEERFTRIRHDQEFPGQAIKYCLRQAGITIDQVDYVGFYDKPLIKFERILEQYMATWPKSYLSFIKATPLWLRKKLWIPHLIKKELGYQGEVLMIEHHLSHAPVPSWFRRTGSRPSSRWTAWASGPARPFARVSTTTSRS